LAPGERWPVPLGAVIETGLAVLVLHQAAPESHAKANVVEPPGGIVFESEPMRRLFEMLDPIAASRLSVLVLGETGVGKDVVARAIHERSPRAKGRFVALNCAALPETIVESELFGHAKGAFTGAQQAKTGYFEAADGGTIFLDEVGDLSASTQARLLRV